MYANKLLDEYKTAKNYVQDKQIAADLGISKQKISGIRNGLCHLTETEAIFLAKNTNIDPKEALIRISADKAKSFEAKQMWNDIMAKMSSRGWNVASLGMTGFFAAKLSAIECVLWSVLC